MKNVTFSAGAVVGYVPLPRGRPPMGVSYYLPAARRKLIRLHDSLLVTTQSYVVNRSELASILMVAGWKQDEMAQHFGVTRRTVIRWCGDGSGVFAGRKLEILRSLVASLVDDVTF